MRAVAKTWHVSFETLNRHFVGILMDVCDDRRLWIGDILSGGKLKNRSIADARVEIVERLRRTVSYKDNCTVREYAVHEPGERPAGMFKVSFPVLGHLLNMDHSTIIAISHRGWQRRQKELEASVSRETGWHEAT